MVSLGEMISYLPVPGGHITMAERFVDSAWSFTLGWNYCASSPPPASRVLTHPQGTTGPSFSPQSLAPELCSSDFGANFLLQRSASVLIGGRRTQKVNDAAWITVFLVVVIVINMFGARTYLAPP